MPLIKNGERVGEDAWSFISDDTAVPTSGCVTVTLARFKAERDLLGQRNTKVGVRLEPHDDPHELSEDLARIGLIEVTFPKFADGRGYSQAQLLRRRLGYDGELRAIGDVLRDQVLFMVRSGFDALELANTDEVGFAHALSEFRHYYQSDARGAAPIFQRRHGGGK
ncbi:MAG: DUF934 domain-containing protein [Pseudomonadota bacterium]